MNQCGEAFQLIPLKMKSFYNMKSVFTIFGKYVYGLILIVIFREYIKGFPLVKSESYNWSEPQNPEQIAFYTFEKSQNLWENF